MDGRVSALVAVVASITLVGCGSGGQTSTSAPSAGSATSSTATSTSVPASPSGGSAVVTAGPVRGRLRGADHTPVQGRNWAYAVEVTDAGGHPLSGTVEIQFVFGDQVVGRDQPRFHPVRGGRWHDRIVFPPAAVGQPLTFRAVVHTPAGVITLDWPIRVTA